jgi:hypothetical protein
MKLRDNAYAQDTSLEVFVLDVASMEHLINQIAYIFEETQVADFEFYFFAPCFFGFSGHTANSLCNSEVEARTFTFSSLSSFLILSLRNTSTIADTPTVFEAIAVACKFVSQRIEQNLITNNVERGEKNCSRSFTPFHSVLFSKGRDPPYYYYKNHS